MKMTIEDNPTASLRTVKDLVILTKSTLANVLKKLKFHPYKMVPTNILSTTDKERRVLFCTWALNCYSGDTNFFGKILCSDECLFRTSGMVNRQNCRYWAREKPNAVVTEVKDQSAASVMVWAGILNKTIVGPFFFDSKVTQQTYLAMLQNQMMVFLKTALPRRTMKSVIFQQDGAGPHYAIKVRKWLDEVFPGRWIGKHGDNNNARYFWPARSPDISTCDFFLWGFLKSKVYDPSLPRMKTKDELITRIRWAFDQVTTTMLEGVVDTWPIRLQCCLAHDGDHFEHKIDSFKRLQ